MNSRSIVFKANDHTFPTFHLIFCIYVLVEATPWLLAVLLSVFTLYIIELAMRVESSSLEREEHHHR